MTNDINAGSFVSVAQTKQTPENNKGSTVLPNDSFKIVAKIANSNRLSEVEKSGLISNVALIDKYAKGNLRTKMLNSVSATTLFLERFGGRQTSKNVDVAQATQQYKQTQQVSPPASSNRAELQRQIQNVQKRVEALPQQNQQVSLAEVQRSIPKQDVQAVFSQSVASVAKQSGVQVQQLPTLAESRQSAQANLEVSDQVNISANAKAVQDLALPGSGGGEEIPPPGAAPAVDIPLPGAGAAADIPVLGSGDFEEVALPGGSNIESDIAARIAALEDRGVPELPLPGGIAVGELAEKIASFPQEALDSIGEVLLPGQGGGSAENGSVNERAARVALSV